MYLALIMVTLFLKYILIRWFINVFFVVWVLLIFLFLISYMHLKLSKTYIKIKTLNKMLVESVVKHYVVFEPFVV